MENKRTEIIKTASVIITTLAFVLFLMWWNGLTPKIGRAGIEKRLDRVLTIDYEYVSSARVGSEKHYTYKDANGLEFTVKSFKRRAGIYASDVSLWSYNVVECNYTLMFIDQYDSYIMGLFGDRVEHGYSDDYRINVSNYEQLVETADILAKIYAEISPFQINTKAGDYLYKIGISRISFGVTFGYEYEKYLGGFSLSCAGEVIPGRDSFLEEMESGLASAIKRGSIIDYIDMDTIPQRVLDMANE